MSQRCLEPTYKANLAAECSTNRSVGGMGPGDEASARLVAVTATTDSASILKATCSRAADIHPD